VQQNRALDMMRRGGKTRPKPTFDATHISLNNQAKAFANKALENKTPFILKNKPSDCLIKYFLGRLCVGNN
jgi:hypothetical protein